MRCKNCGCENDDNAYICKNCGSPLYDEDEVPGVQNNDDSTRMFAPAADNYSENRPKHDYDDYIDNFNNKTRADLPDYSSDPYQQQRRAENSGRGKRGDDEDKKKKRQIAVIVILIIVLIAIIAGIIAAAANGRRKNESTTESSTSATVAAVEEETTRKRTTTERTTEETTTEKTTTSTTTTTKRTTTSTTKSSSYKVTVSTNDFGYADGGGTYKKGDTATVTCGGDDGTEFIGWYKNGTKVSDSQTYSFTVDGDTSLEARFKEADDSNDSGNDNGDSGSDSENAQ